MWVNLTIIRRAIRNGKDIEFISWKTGSSRHNDVTVLNTRTMSTSKRSSFGSDNPILGTGYESTARLAQAMASFDAGEGISAESNSVQPQENSILVTSPLNH